MKDTNALPALDLIACSRPRTDLLEMLEHDERQSGELELEPYSVRIEFSGELNELFSVIRNAASELEGQGEKSDRIAKQLLQGLATFCLQTGCP